MSYKTNRDLRALFSLFPRSDDGNPITLPDVILDEIRPVVDLGSLATWAAYDSIQYTVVSSGVDGITFLDGPVVPEGQLRLIINATVSDNGADVGDRLLWLTKRDPAALGNFGLTNALRYTTAELVGVVSLLRPIILAPGERLRGNRQPGSPVGTTLNLNLGFISVPLPEALAVPVV